MPLAALLVGLALLALLVRDDQEDAPAELAGPADQVELPAPDPEAPAPPAEVEP